MSKLLVNILIFQHILPENVIRRQQTLLFSGCLMSFQIFSDYQISFLCFCYCPEDIPDYPFYNLSLVFCPCGKRRKTVLKIRFQIHQRGNAYNSNQSIGDPPSFFSKFHSCDLSCTRAESSQDPVNYRPSHKSSQIVPICSVTLYLKWSLGLVQIENYSTNLYQCSLFKMERIPHLFSF